MATVENKMANYKAHLKCPPQLMMCTVYSLNDSFSRKVYVGFQVNNDGYPVEEIRICSSDFVGSRFTSYKWHSFIQCFREISRFFEREPRRSSMLQEKLSGVGFSVRFILRRRYKYVEIEDDRCENAESIEITNDVDSVGNLVVKAPRVRIVLNYKNFRNLEKILPLISARLRYLKTIQRSYVFVMCEIINQAEDRYLKTHENFRKDNLLLSDPKFEDVDFYKLSETLKTENLYRLTGEDIRIMYTEIVNLKYNANNFCQWIPSSDLEARTGERIDEEVEDRDDEEE